MSSTPDSGVPIPAALLPVPTDAVADVGAALLDLAAHRGCRADVLIGPDDSGKSAILRALGPAYRGHGGQVRFLDLSLHNWQLILDPERAPDVLMIDHIDRMPSPDHLAIAFAILDRAIPALFSAGMARLVIAFSSEWCATFTGAYRLAPEVVLRQAISSIQLVTHTIRPLSDAELTKICTDLGLRSNGFSDPSLRRAGVLTMASSTSAVSADTNGSMLREVLVVRWLAAGNDQQAREARRAVWGLMGARTLHGNSFHLSARSLYTELEGRFSTELLRTQAGGPLRWENDEVQPESPAWGDLAAATALRNLIAGQDSPALLTPLRSTVLDALIDISDAPSLERLVRNKLHDMSGRDFGSVGYLGPALGTLLARLPGGTALEFVNLSLQGPNHSDLRAIAPTIARTVEEALLIAMRTSFPALLLHLSSALDSAVSAYRGGYECWASARAWAAALALRAAAEDAAMSQLPKDGSWHYEDILDVSVTGATTRLMQEHEGQLAELLQDSPSLPREYLADIWDGINDGAWDQIDANSRDFVSALRLPAELGGRMLTAIDCKMQRARIGAHDATRWRLLDCDLFLADFRSCQNLEATDFDGSDWWNAILPPPARYHLSRSCADRRFLDWCANPPWRNPYYLYPWPRPFD